MTIFNVVLFDDFETLDVFGPVEVIGCLPESYGLKYHSMKGGIVISRHQTLIETLPFAEIDPAGVLLIPGGMGTRSLADNDDFISQLRVLAQNAPHVLTVCTGSGLLAKTGLLDGLSATSNKRAFAWASSNSEKVDWIKKARWVKDGKYYTSSGVSAGIDMTLGFLSDLHDRETAEGIANRIEYIWNCDMDNDPFAVE